MILKIIASVLAANLLGMLWYGQTLFGSTWARLAFPGKDISDLGKDGMVKPLVLSMVGNVIVTVFVNYLLGSVFMVKTLYDTVCTALLLASMVSATQICHCAFYGRPLGLFLIDQGFDSAVIMSTSLVVFYLS